jgi:N6-L-threonylcarbamoyladenine synthase
MQELEPWPPQQFEVYLTPMKVLAIETSCDETGIALLEGRKEGQALIFETKKAALLSQALLHSPYGGVYPNLAKREHEKNLPALFEQFKDEVYDAVAVTQGPGLEPALWTGIEFAKKVAAEKGIPLIPVNHMEGHFISSMVRKNVLEGVQTPILALLISGGHTEFVLMKEWLKYEIVGKTLDDAVGEAFDKVARMLGLPYPGGPEISKLAEKHRKGSSPAEGPRISSSGEIPQTPARPDHSSEKLPFRLPRPMINSGTCDFSFSGLKTAALYALRDRGGIQTLSQDEIAAFSAELEEAIADVLVSKTKKALWDTRAKTFVIGGGVAANRYIREKIEAMLLEEFPDVDLRLPELSITGDNAIMIAQAALARALSGIDDTNKDGADKIRAVGNLSIAAS